MFPWEQQALAENKLVHELMHKLVHKLVENKLCGDEMVQHKLLDDVLEFCLDYMKLFLVGCV